MFAADGTFRLSIRFINLLTGICSHNPRFFREVDKGSTTFYLSAGQDDFIAWFNCVSGPSISFGQGAWICELSSPPDHCPAFIGDIKNNTGVGVNQLQGHYCAHKINSVIVIASCIAMMSQ